MTAEDHSTKTSVTLAVVMPVYNEADCIAPVVCAWHAMLVDLKIDFRIIALNDGSQDKTLEMLRRLDNLPHLEIVDKPNTGHGPTILHGYTRAVREAEWIFQVDSDDETTPDDFPRFWSLRDGADFVFGIRTGRMQTFGRRIISIVTRKVVRLTGTVTAQDVNVPFRLMRCKCLAAILPRIPPGTFAPNVVISWLAARGGCEIVNIPIGCRPRRSGGSPSLDGLRVWKAAPRAFFQTCAIMWRHRRFRCAC